MNKKQHKIGKNGISIPNQDRHERVFLDNIPNRLRQQDKLKENEYKYKLKK